MNQEIQSDVPFKAGEYETSPPFGADIIYASLVDAEMQHIKPRILIEVDKGFFKADEGIWTCYRRNYFDVRCQFELKPNPRGILCLVVEQRLLPVGRFYVTLTAKTTSTDDVPSKPIQLVRYSPKRDRGPTAEVGLCELAPVKNEISLAPRSELTFDRMQFKNATANNGKRRAAQQFYTLVLELWCTVIGDDRYKIAERVSTPMVVRGRSPGHYASIEASPLIQNPLAVLQPNLVLPHVMLVPNLYGLPLADPVLIHRPPAKHIRQEEFQTSGQHSNESALAEFRDFDVSSISSSSDVFSHRSVAMSVTSSGGPVDLSDFVVSVLLDDEGIKNLCIDGFSSLNPDKFERHLRRTLKSFAKHLATEPSGRLSKDFGSFLRRRVAALARNIREQVPTLESLENPFSQFDQAEKAISVEQYDNGKDNGSEVDLDDSDLDHDGDGEEVKVEADIFPSIKAKIISSNSFETLREDLLDFVVPFMLHGEMNGQDVQKLQNRYSYKNRSNNRAAAIFPKPGHQTTSRSTCVFVSQWFEFRWLERSMIKLRHLWSKVNRPKVESGDVRREFICECGEMLWGDFENISTGDYRAIEYYSSQPIEQQYSASPAAPITAQQAISGGVGLVPGTPGILRPFGTSTAFQQSNAACGSLTHRSSPISNARYLELCINIDQYNIVLEEIDISAVNAIHMDGQLFREIRRRYDQARSRVFVHKFKLFKPKSVHFVQFCVSDQSVGILQSPRAIPTDSQDYEFSPCPMKDPPPVPESIFMHLLMSERPHLRNIWLSRLPKKRDTRILPAQSTIHQGTSYATGWGVHIIESPNGDAIFRITVASVLTNLLLALIYIGATHGDVQGAFAISAFLVTGESAITFSYFHYHNAG